MKRPDMNAIYDLLRHEPAHLAAAEELLSYIHYLEANIGMRRVADTNADQLIRAFKAKAKKPKVQV